MHESPLVPNYGQAGQGMLLREGMTLAIEPMLLVGTRYTRELKNQWTVISRDRSLTAHQEHTIAITANGPEIMTRL
jgi:methionyl aminopeptidase